MPQPQRANDGEADGQHRLTDIFVEEVSFVDRGANKKRFLLLKRKGGEMARSSELVPDGRGGMRRATSKREGDEEEEDDKEKAAGGKKKPPPFGGNQAPPFKKKPKKPSDEEEGDEDEEEDDAEKARGKDDEDEEDEGDDAEKSKTSTKKGAVRKNMLAAVTQAIELLMDVAEDLKDDSADEDEEGEYEPSGDVMDSAKKAMGLLAKICGPASKASGDKTEKAGRRMSKERLDRFQKALADLSSILKEVMNTPELKDDAEKRAGALQKALAKVAKAIGGAGGDDARVDELVGAVSTLTEHVRELEGTNKVLRKRVERLRKGDAEPNARGVEGREEGGDRGGEIDWPMDLTREISRDKTEKGMSFYEDEGDE